jgi:hypothetical protein
VGLGWEDSGKPGLVMKSIGRGTVAWLPWDVGSLYHLHSLESHREILVNLVDRLIPAGRDLSTNAQPPVAMSLMRQHERHHLHMVDMSGHADTDYFEPLPVQNIEVEPRARFTRARAGRADEQLKVPRKGDWVTRFFDGVYLQGCPEYLAVERST